jgi:hypothetical protein
MTRQAVGIIFVALVLFLLSASVGGQTSTESPTHASWDISATSSTLAEWASERLLGKQDAILTNVLSVREDGCFLGAGSLQGVTVGQVFEIYRPARDGGREEIAGFVQVAWTRDDYCFALPRGGLDMADVSSLHFARLVHVAPTVALVSDTSEGGGGPELDALLRAIHALLSARGNIRPVLGEPGEPAWTLTVTPDLEGVTVRATLSAPDGEVSGTITLDPSSGQRLAGETWLDPSYLTGAHTPFEHYLAPPGRRTVRIAAGNLVAGVGDELVVLDGADFWVYDLSGPQARLLSSLSVSIPPGPVRHREDNGSLELGDLDGNGLADVCVAPPGASRGEVWRLEGDDWVQLGFLPHPARALAPKSGAVLVLPSLIDAPALDSSFAFWFFPLEERASFFVQLNFSPTGIASLPESDSDLPALLAVDLTGTLFRVSSTGEHTALAGKWGDCVRVASYRTGPIALVSSPWFEGDVLTLLDPVDGEVIADFPVPGGSIIDIALGDIDKDNKAEILVAALAEEGVRIYY